MLNHWSVFHRLDDWKDDTGTKQRLLPSHNPFHFNFRLFFVSNSFIRWRWCNGNKQTIESTDIQLKNIWIYSLVKLFHFSTVCGRSPATGTHSLIHLISVVLTLVHAPFPWRNTAQPQPVTGNLVNNVTSLPSNANRVKTNEMRKTICCLRGGHLNITFYPFAVCRESRKETIK